MNPRLALVIFCFAAIVTCCGKPTMDGHGLGFLQRVRNNSEYPISFSQSKTILDYLPNDTVIRIKSLRKEYGVTGRYYAVRKMVGAYRLEADTLDPEDLATHFVIKRFVSRDFTEYIGIYSDSAEGMFMKSDDTRAITFSLPDMMDDKTPEGHWSVIDASGNSSNAISDKKFMDPNFAANVFNNCYLKCRASGVMQARGTPGNYPGTNNPPRSKYSNPILQGLETSADPAKPGIEAKPSSTTDAEAGAEPETPATPASPASAPTASGAVTTLSSVKCSIVNAADTVVAITKTGMATRQKEDESWENLDQGLNGVTLVSIGTATDGTTWGCDVNNNVWSHDSSKNLWTKVQMPSSTGPIIKVILASASQIWILSRDGAIFQRMGSDTNIVWQQPSPTVGSGGVKDFCITPNGIVFVLCNDNKIYKGTNIGSTYTFSQFAAPKDTLNTVPYAITAGNGNFVAFSTLSDEVYVLVAGKSGNTADSWKQLTTPDGKSPIKLRSLAASKNNSLAGVVSSSGKPEDNTVIMIRNITTA